jgi:hypothetical protein
VDSGWSAQRAYRVSDRIDFIRKYRRFDSRGRYVGKWAVDVVDKDAYQAYTASDYYQARAIQIAIVAFGIDPPDTDDGRVPISIAQSGNATIAVYLYGGVMRDAEDVCEVMDISEDTLKKYVRRLEKRFGE